MATYNSFKRIASDSFVANTLTSGDIATGAITNGKLATDAVTSADIVAGAVGTGQLDTTLDISAKTVTYRTIVNTDISASAAIASTKLATGAATTNLGYTPLNKNGNAMTGALLTTAGSAAAPAIALTGNTNTGIYFAGDNTVRISTAGVERARFDPSGRFLQGTSQSDGSPMFQSHGTNGWLYNNQLGAGTGWQEINGNFGWTGYQRGGSGFNYASGAGGGGRYTAPVAGFYNFQWLSYQHNDTSWTSATGHMHMSLSKNGGISPSSSRTPHGIWAHGNGSPYPHGFSWQIDTYLNAGDYASVFAAWTSNNNRFHASHSFFNGYLIG
jgi:hypothetical protein